MNKDINDTEMLIIKDISKIASSISMFSSVIVIGLYWFFKEIRQIALELVVWLCISVFLFNLSSFIPFDTNMENNEFWCAAQAYMITSFQNSAIIWCGVIGYTAYIGVNDPSKLENHEKRYRIIFILVANILPMLLSTVYVIFYN